MATLNYGSKELICKIVYYGPGYGGKTTNLLQMHKRLPEGRRGEMTSLATSQDRTLYFDLLPVELGRIGSYFVKVQLYTVPGQVQYTATRKMVLNGVDGVVMVFDSSPERENANYLSLADLEENLSFYDIRIDRFPVVFQYNKRDLKEAMPREFMSRALNPEGRYPEMEAVACDGIGVTETFRKICQMVFERLEKEIPTVTKPAEPEPADDLIGVANTVRIDAPAAAAKTAGRKPQSRKRSPANPDRNDDLNREIFARARLPVRQLCEVRRGGLVLGHGTLQARFSAEEAPEKSVRLKMSLQTPWGRIDGGCDLLLTGVHHDGKATVSRYEAPGRALAAPAAPVLLSVERSELSPPDLYLKWPLSRGSLQVAPAGAPAVRWPRKRSRQSDATAEFAAAAEEQP